MPTIVRCGLIQCSNPVNDESVPVADIQKAMLDKHIPFIEDAGKKGVQILGLQEIFNGPYFCPSQDTRWYEAAEPVPGPMVELMSTYAKKYKMVMVVPVYEKEMPGVLYNTAVTTGADMLSSSIGTNSAAGSRAVRITYFVKSGSTDSTLVAQFSDGTTTLTAVVRNGETGNIAQDGILYTTVLEIPAGYSLNFRPGTNTTWGLLEGVEVTGDAL